MPSMGLQGGEGGESLTCRQPRQQVLRKDCPSLVYVGKPRAEVTPGDRSHPAPKVWGMPALPASDTDRLPRASGIPGNVSLQTRGWPLPRVSLKRVSYLKLSQPNLAPCSSQPPSP